MKHIKKFNESELAAYYRNGIGGSSEENFNTNLTKVILSRSKV